MDFRDHRRDLHQNRYVYAVVSRRSRGLSIGVNLNPDKVCNWDCPYCQVDRTVPGAASREVDLAVLEAEMLALLDHVQAGTLWDIAPFDTAAPALRRVSDIAFAGDGEPTSCPQFGHAIERVGRLRAAFGLEGVGLNLLTNATLFHRPKVWAGLERLDALGGDIWAKLDAGTQEWFEVVDGTSLPLERVLANVQKAACAFGVTLQCMFIRWDDQPPQRQEIDAWADRLAALIDGGGTIRQVQVYTVARTPADGRVSPLEGAFLQDIAGRAEALGLPTVVAGGVALTEDKP